LKKELKHYSPTAIISISKSSFSWGIRPFNLWRIIIIVLMNHSLTLAQEHCLRSRIADVPIEPRQLSRQAITKQQNKTENICNYTELQHTPISNKVVWYPIESNKLQDNGMKISRMTSCPESVRFWRRENGLFPFSFDYY
jgi:hypothetical protein